MEGNREKSIKIGSVKSIGKIVVGWEILVENDFLNFDLTIFGNVYEWKTNFLFYYLLIQLI